MDRYSGPNYNLSDFVQFHCHFLSSQSFLCVLCALCGESPLVFWFNRYSGPNYNLSDFVQFHCYFLSSQSFLSVLCALCGESP